MTAMTEKGAESIKEKFANIIIGAVKQITENEKIDLGNIKIIKNKSSNMGETDLIKGIIKYLRRFSCRRCAPTETDSRQKRNIILNGI